jgi:hypothetical protein
VRAATAAVQRVVVLVDAGAVAADETERARPVVARPASAVGISGVAAAIAGGSITAIARSSVEIDVRRATASSGETKSKNPEKRAEKDRFHRN